MCGPLALALPVPNARPLGFFLGRLVYNLGRLITYCLLGVLFGLLGKALFTAGFQRGMSITLGVLLLVGLFLSKRVALAAPVVSLLNRLKTTMSGWLHRRSLLALSVLGMLTGLLPCGLVYAACLGAIMTGSVAGGVVYMAIFGIGTFPMMLGLSLSGRLLHVSLRQFLIRLVPASVVVVASLLILRGMSLGIPYVSPDFSAGGPGACCPVVTPHQHPSP
jgi:sulfite exporter TauE/SafE